MNFTFCYLLAIWEELAYNNKVLKDALFIKNFKILNEKYYLANIRYHNTNYLLCPYYDIYYHL